MWEFSIPRLEFPNFNETRSRGFQDGVVGTTGGVEQGRPDVIRFKVRKIPDDCFRRCPIGQHLKDVFDTDAKAADARTASAFPGFNRDHLRIVLSRDGNRNYGVITAQVPITDHVLRSGFAPFLAVMRAVFTNLEATFGRSVLTLRFSYDNV